MKNDFIKELFTLIEENPTLPIRCAVNGDIFSDDGYKYYLGKVNYEYKPIIREYTTDILDGNIISFKDDDDWEYWFECLFNLDNYEYVYEYVSNDDWLKFCTNMVNRKVKWEKAIFITIIPAKIPIW